ncbi:hypothetical protein [Rhodococcus sp. IEGM 1330]|nr:hypothetical protein [Rhodococcus sp. IEGM 1330]MDV8023550.1 hypothetical protein [Rhodococcus sp. IEGM 1330]
MIAIGAVLVLSMVGAGWTVAALREGGRSAHGGPPRSRIDVD